MISGVGTVSELLAGPLLVGAWACTAAFDGAGGVKGAATSGVVGWETS